MFSRNLFRKVTDRERKKICIDQNGIEEENFEKRRICIGKTEGNSLKLKHLKCVKFYYGLWDDIIQNVSKKNLFMVLIQVSKIPTLFYILIFLGQKTKWFCCFLAN